MTDIIDGKSEAQFLQEQLSVQTAKLLKEHNIIPGLAVILVGDDPASAVYVRNKEKTAEKLGMHSTSYRLHADVSEKELLATINFLNQDTDIHGILLQLPLPKHISEKKMLAAINPTKDVDGFHPHNIGRLSIGDKQDNLLVPCTPLGCLHLLRSVTDSLPGKNALIIGRSNIVGKPMAQLLLAENCTVTIAHSHTSNLPILCQEADIVVAAVGRPHFVQADWIKDDAILIDVGINRITKEDNNKQLVGDFNFDDIIKQGRAKAITPVPGGVGPMTIAYLMKNTLNAALNSTEA